MVFQPTGPGARTVRVKIQKNKAGKFRWTLAETPTASNGSDASR